LLAEFAPEDHRIDFVVVEEAAPIQIGRPRSEPDAVTAASLGARIAVTSAARKKVLRCENAGSSQDGAAAAHAGLSRGKL